MIQTAETYMIFPNRQRPIVMKKGTIITPTNWCSTWDIIYQFDLCENQSPLCATYR